MFGGGPAPLDGRRRAHYTCGPLDSCNTGCRIRNPAWGAVHADGIGAEHTRVTKGHARERQGQHVTRVHGVHHGGKAVSIDREQHLKST